jgi:DNA-binding SARP family transcriptional activator
MDFRILGPLEASDGGVALRLGGRKQRALLACLLLDANRTVAIDHLVDDLWGEEPPDTSVKMVQIYVSHLRKVLPDGVLRTQPPGYVLAVPPEAIDLHGFERLRAAGREALARGDPAGASERLREALAIWRGPALAEFVEPFAAPQRARLDELRLGCIEDRIDADLALGRHHDLAGELEALVARHPLREPLRAQLMLALYRSGRQADALATYRAFRAVLDENLGIDPSPRLRDLEHAILHQDPSLETLPPMPFAEPEAPVAIPAPRPAPPAPAGRTPELNRLGTALASTLGGQRKLVLLGGEAGVGKTTLVEAFLAGAAHGDVLVGRGQCVEHRGPGEPYLPVLDALGRLARAHQGELVVRLLAQRAPTWLVQMPWLVPDEQLATLHQRAHGATRERMLREALEALEAVADVAPLVLVLEDLHWSDASTLDLLAALARRTEPARLLVIATYRPGGQKEEALARDLRMRGLCELLAVTRLDDAGVTEYLEARFPGSEVPAKLAPLLRARTGGNPLFITHLVGHWLDEGAIQENDPAHLTVSPDQLAEGVPATLRACIEDELAALDPTDAEVLSAASVAGVDFAVAAVAAALARPVESVAHRLTALAARGVWIEPRGEAEWADGTVSPRFAFAHDLHREVLYDQLSGELRAELHRRIGLRLERARAPVAELADHFVRGRDQVRAARFLERAAEVAFARNAHSAGIGHLRDALAALASLPDSAGRTRRQIELLSMLGQALVAIDGWSSPEAEERLREARARAERLRDNEPLVSVLLALATLYEVRGQFARAHETLEACLELAPGGPPNRRLEWQELVACNLFRQGSFSRALAQAEDGVATFEEGAESGEYSTFPATLGDNAGVSCHDWAGLALWFLGYPDQALERARRALQLAEDPSRAYSLATARAQLSFVHQCRLEPEATFEWAEATIASATALGYTYRVAGARVLRGWAMTARGEIGPGIEELLAGIDAARATGAHMDEPHHLGLLADAHRIAGDAEAGLAAVTGALEMARRERSRFYEPELLRLRGVLLLAGGGSEEEAEASLEEGLELARELSSRSLELRTAIVLAALWRRRGRTGQAHSLVAAAYEPFSEGHDTPDLRAAAGLLGGREQLRASG